MIYVRVAESTTAFGHRGLYVRRPVGTEQEKGPETVSSAALSAKGYTQGIVIAHMSALPYSCLSSGPPFF